MYSLQCNIADSTLFLREWNGQDLELMHHFCISTSKTMSPLEEVCNVWESEIPKIGYAYEFLMRGILSLSALHLAYLKPEKQSQYLTSSTFHMALALPAFRTILQSPTEENCCALFAFSSIIMIWICAAPADSVNFRPLENAVELFNLCRGIMSLKDFIPIIRKSRLGSMFSPDYGFDDSML